MQYIADLHLHSRYSRATARDLNIEGLYKHAKIKGIDLIGTGDFTYPQYVKEMEKELEPVGGGLYSFKRKHQIKVNVSDEGGILDPKFIITTEIANIYKRHDKVRRMHTCVWAPGLEEVKELNKQLDKIGNIKSDGRPILGMDVADMVKLIWDVSKDFIIIPAHAWTPWFAIFGSKSGFDTIEECFGDLADKIYAIETGLSSDPPMNWRLSMLDNISLVSNSDAHSLPNLGREATVFDLEDASVKNIKTALQKGKSNKNKISHTIEFHPEEGKYHYDGHRACKFVCDPKQTKKLKGICPKCKKLLTIGVYNRVEELADRDKPQKNGDYKYIVPLQEIIADAFAQRKNTKRVQETYDAMIEKIDNEFNILLKTPLDKIKDFGIPELIEGIRRVREGEIHVEPGYDGEYGVVSVFKKEEQVSAKNRQKTLF
ncbi:endonuclease Q family protein [Patescibacteria group bacterium]|nr:endonuclease Q family protein [Patescibacteria group bacterium]